MTCALCDYHECQFRLSIDVHCQKTGRSMGSQLAAAEYQVAGLLKLAFRGDRRKGPIQVVLNGLSLSISAQAPSSKNIPMDSWLRDLAFLLRLKNLSDTRILDDSWWWHTRILDDSWWWHTRILDDSWWFFTCLHHIFSDFCHIQTSPKPFFRQHPAAMARAIQEIAPILGLPLEGWTVAKTYTTSHGKEMKLEIRHFQDSDRTATGRANRKWRHCKMFVLVG